MKRLLIYTLTAVLFAAVHAEAKKDPEKGKPDKELRQSQEKASAEAAKGLEMKEKADEAAETEKEKAEEMKKKADNDKGRSEEMKKAVDEKKEAQQAAKESGEKMDKEKKSWWKFWKKSTPE